MLPLSPTGRVSRASEEQEQSETQSVLWHSLALFFAAFYIFHTPYDAAFGGLVDGRSPPYVAYVADLFFAVDFLLIWFAWKNEAEGEMKKQSRVHPQEKAGGSLVDDHKITSIPPVSPHIISGMRRLSQQHRSPPARAPRTARCLRPRAGQARSSARCF